MQRGLVPKPAQESSKTRPKAAQEPTRTRQDMPKAAQEMLRAAQEPRTSCPEPPRARPKATQSRPGAAKEPPQSAHPPKATQSSSRASQDLCRKWLKKSKSRPKLLRELLLQLQLTSLFQWCSFSFSLPFPMGGSLKLYILELALISAPISKLASELH